MQINKASMSAKVIEMATTAQNFIFLFAGLFCIVYLFRLADQFQSFP